jgi:hypothetical protein
MDDNKSLCIRLRVPDGDLSPTEFVSLFECADRTARAIVEQEAAELLEELRFPQDYRLQTLQTIHRLSRKVPTPAEVTNVERGSWQIDVIIRSAFVLFMLKEYVHPTVRAAFDDSRAKQVVVEFLRDRVFGGAKRKVEETAVANPRYGNLDVVSVNELPASPSQPSLQIELHRRELYVVKSSDQELIHDFIERLGGK